MRGLGIGGSNELHFGCGWDLWRSDLQYSRLPLYSKMRAPGGIKSPLGQAGSWRSLLRAERKVWQSGAGTAY